MDSIHLIGADKIERAGHNMSAAADRMQHGFDMALQRFEFACNGLMEAAQLYANAIAANGEIVAMQVENQDRQSRGHSIGYDGLAFDEVLKKYGLYKEG